VSEATEPLFGSPIGTVELAFDPEGKVATITFDRAPKLNALTPEMLEALGQALTEVKHSRAAALVLRARAGKVFCVGADIERFSGLAPVEMWRDWTTRGHDVFEALAHLRQPSVAVVHGHAFGGGLELALACDFRIAADGALLGLPEVGLGTVPGWGGTGRLTKLIGAARTKDVVLARRQIDAGTALDWGLVSRVAPLSGLDAELDDLIRSITGAAPIAVQLAKQLIDGAAEGVATPLLESLAGGLTAATADLAEGIAAFRDRRPPTFGGN